MIFTPELHLFLGQFVKMGAQMRVKSVSGLVTALLVAGLVSACSSAGRTMITKQSGEPIEADTTATLVVEPTDGNQPENRLDAARRIHAELSRRLVADRIFKSLVEEPDTGDYILKVKVQDVSETPPGVRAVFGFIGPRNSVQVGVDLRRGDSDKRIKSFQATGYGARNWMSAQGYGIDDPVREVVEQVIFQLK